VLNVFTSTVIIYKNIFTQRQSNWFLHLSISSMEFVKLTINYILFGKVLPQKKLVFKVWQLTLKSIVFRAVWQPIGKIVGIKKNKVPLVLRFKSAKGDWLVPVFQFFCLFIMIKQTIARHSSEFQRWWVFQSHGITLLMAKNQ